MSVSLSAPLLQDLSPSGAPPFWEEQLASGCPRLVHSGAAQRADFGLGTVTLYCFLQLFVRAVAEKSISFEAGECS